jgi:hypothetical protein
MTSEYAVTALIDKIEKETNWRCPPENKKNIYLKVCWLLSVYQNANLFFKGQDEGIRQFVEDLKSLLPELRERVAMNKGIAT